MFLAVAIIYSWGAGISSARAAEPAERFLERLRGEGYYDLAIRYLDSLDSYPAVAEEFKAAVDLERAQTLLEAAARSRNRSEKEDYFTRATEGLQRFLQEQPDSPRKPQAQMQLGNLQLVRGAEAMEAEGSLTPERRATAREAFLGAAATFDAIVAELREKLLAMQGQRIDAQTEPEKVALRDRYRSEYLQALLLAGDATKRAAETFEAPSGERKKLYGEALGRFDELSDKYDDQLAGVLATLYAGQVHQAIGESEKAVDRYLVVLDQRNHDLLRAPKVKAATGLIRVYLAKEPPELKEAIARGQPWADDVRPDERQRPEWQELRVALADAYLAQAGQAESSSDARRDTAAARQLLIAASKVPSAVQTEASERLASLGVDVEQSSALERAQSLPKTFDETMAVVHQILEEEKNLTLSIELIERRAAEGEAVETDPTQIRQSLETLRARGIDLLRHALSLTGSQTDSSAIHSARGSLAFLLYRNGQLRDAAVVGSFIARRYPNSDVALSSGLTALSSLHLALRDAGESQSDGLLRQIQDLADYLTQQWPNDPRVATAHELLVRIAIVRGQFDDARRYLDNVPPAMPAKSELQRAMGKLMWNRYVELQQAGDSDAATAMRDQAAETLATGLANLPADQVDGGALEAALLLARIELLRDRPAAALATLDSDRYGPLQRLDEMPPPSDGFRGEAFAVALQAVVSQLALDGVDTDALMGRASDLVAGLQKAYEGQPESDQKLVATYFRLARDIRSQLDTAPPEKKQQLTSAFRLFLDSLAAQTDDAKTLHWAAQTLLQLGQGMTERPDAKATGQAAELVSGSIKLLEKIAARGAREPNWLSSDQMLSQVRLELGTAARSVGNYKQAIDTLSELLAENPMLIDAQVEAALVYEQWAATLPEQYALISYRRAIAGAKPDPKTGRNTVWGWGAIAKRTMGQDAFSETFFNARYHLALSRFLQGKKESDADRKKKLYEQAGEDIRNVLVRYPELGGAATRTKYDALLREIQKSLGKRAIGLAEYETPMAKS